MTEYRETGYGSDRYPPREGADPESGGTVYRGGVAQPGDQELPPEQDHDARFDPAASIRGRVWRPTRGPRAEGSSGGYGAPDRGWRTSDGGYRSSDGGWQAPYRPYDTGELTGDQRLSEPPHTGEMVRYDASAAEAAGHPANGASGTPTTGTPRYPASGAPGYPGGARDAGRRPTRPGETGEIVRRSGAANPYTTGGIPRYPAVPDPRASQPRRPADETGSHARYDTDGRGRHDTDGRGRHDTGSHARYDTDGRGRYDTGGHARYETDGRGRLAGGGRPAGAAGGRIPGGAAGGGSPGATTAGGGTAGRLPAVRRQPTMTGENSRIPRQLPGSPASPAGTPPPPSKRRPAGGGRRDDSPELYSYDPLTLGGGESPAMRYDRATDSYIAEPPAPPSAPAVSRSALPDVRRPSRGPGPGPADPRADPRAGEPRTVGFSARAIEARGHDGRGPNGFAPATGYAQPRYEREPAPGPRPDLPATRPADRRPDQPPVRRAPAPPPQRFEGTYPPQSVRGPRNMVPLRRPALDPDEDEDDDDQPGYFHTALVTTAWYTVPLLLYTMYVLTLDGSAQAGDGHSPRENALNGLLGGMPRVGVALATSLAVALMIRVISRGWRAATIGFASAVVGAGAATVIFAALTG